MNTIAKTKLYRYIAESYFEHGANAANLRDLSGIMKADGIGETERLSYLAIAARGVNEQINYRANVERRLNANRNGDSAFVEVWSRDCDCAESTYCTRIRATVPAFFALLGQLGENAEGPYRVRILTLEEAASFKPSHRDRALEAFEDGHPYSIYD